MIIPLGALCSTGRIVEDVRQALFRGQATNRHNRVHSQQPQGEDAFGYAFADILNNCVEPKQYDAAGKKHLLEAAKDKAVLSDVFDECWPRETQTGIPYPLKKTPRFSIAAPPYIERICYATFNYRAGYTAENHIVYAKETVLTAFREYTPSPFLPTPLRPSLCVVLTVHMVMYIKQRNLHGLVGVLAQQQNRVGGIIKHNTNAVKNLAATQAVPGDNVDEGSSPEPPAKKAKQPATPAAGGPARGRGGAGAMRAGGGPFGSRAGRRAAAAAATTREQHVSVKQVVAPPEVIAVKEEEAADPDEEEDDAVAEGMIELADVDVDDVDP
eukprot:jgi/Tetstr1/442066/TSEL_030245.t1